MRVQSQSKRTRYSYYRCKAHELGHECQQRAVRTEEINDQVVATLMQLKPPAQWRKGITKAMSELLGEKNLEERLSEIKAIIERMDKRWDHGFVTNEEEYIQQRIKLQMELEQLSPVADDELEQAADLLANFRTHWERLEGNKEARHELIKLIVERVYVKDKQIVAMTLRSNYHLVLGHKTNDQPWLRLTHFYTEAGATGLDTALGIGVWSGYQRSNHTNSLSIQDFMAFFFPTAHEAIDWEKGYIFLDKDL